MFIKLIDIIWDYTFEPHGYIKAMLYDIFTKVKPASSGHTRIATNGLRTTSTRLSRFCLVLRFFFLFHLLISAVHNTGPHQGQLVLEEEDLDTSRLLKLMLMLKLKLMLLEVVDLAKLPRIPLSWSAATWTPWCTRSTLSWAESCRWCPICCLSSSFRLIPPQVDTELGEMAKYYFDGAGKGLRPVIAMCVGHAFNVHTGKVGKAEEGQRMVAIISEMIHTASLVHDDILDHAETRRGKVRVRKEGNCKIFHKCSRSR